MRHNRVLVSFVVLMLLIMPVASQAQSTGDLQSNIISLLQQIITLQKQLIETLQNQITQLSSQITNLQKQLPPVSSQISVPHACAIVNPPSCSVAPTVTRDSYNCAIAYSCASPATTPSNTNSGALCSYNGQQYVDGFVLTIPVNCGLSAVVYCPSTRQTCHNGNWTVQMLDPYGNPYSSGYWCRFCGNACGAYYWQATQCSNVNTL